MDPEEAPAPPRGGLVRRVVRAVLWPVRRFFDPRFTGVYNAVVDVRRLLITDMEAANETATLTGRTLDRLLAQNEELLARLGAGADGEGPAGRPWQRVAVAYAFRALASVPPGATVATVGTQDAWVPAALEGLGYEVTTDHGLRTAHREGEFDAVVCFGARDLEERMRLLRHLTKPGGLLVLVAGEGDSRRLDDLLRGYERSDVTRVDGVGALVTATKNSA